MSYSLQDPDVRLMLLVREDDASAFEQLVLRYQGKIQSILRHRVGDADLADDLAQETFLRVYRARKTYTPEAKFKTWLYTIANNVALNALRNRARRPEAQFGSAYQSQKYGDSDPMSAENSVSARSSLLPTRLLDTQEMEAVVRDAINSLSERQRWAVFLNKFEGMSYIDIAETMEMTPQAVKSLLCRARCNLKDLITPYLEKGIYRNLK